MIKPMLRAVVTYFIFRADIRESQGEQLEREREKESDTRKSFSAPRALSCCVLCGHSSTCSAHTCSQVDAVSILWCVDICSAFCTVELSLLTCMGVRRQSWQMRAGMGANVIVQ